MADDLLAAPGPPPPPRFLAMLDRPGVGLAVALGLAFAWSSALLWLRPEGIVNEQFVVFDQGQSLFLTDQLVAGQRLYRDVFSQYGPLPAYVQAAWAACFGNTARTHLLLMQLLTLVDAGLLYRLLRRNVSAPVVLAWLTVAVYPFLLLPGSFNASPPGAIYPGFERCALLCIALTWTDPQRRTRAQALRLGLLLGAMQWVKFGGAFVAGAALLLTDLLIMGRGLASREGRRQTVEIMLCTLAGFLAVEGLGVAAAFLTLPAAIARDVLWPVYMLKNYASYTGNVPHYVSWEGVRYFVEAQLPVALAGLLNLGLLWRVLTRRDDAPERRGPLVFFACYFPLAVAIYLPHVWLAIVSAWIFVSAGVSVFEELPRPARALVLLGMLPCFLISVRSVVPGPWHQETFVTMDFPNGERLWTTPELKASLVKTQAVVDALGAQRPPSEASSSPRLVIFPIGSGWFHYYPYLHSTRHGYLMAGFVRPDEETALVRSLDRTTAIVVYSPDGLAASFRSDPGSWPVGLNPLFSPVTNAAFVQRLDTPILVDAHCVVFPVKH